MEAYKKEFIEFMVASDVFIEFFAIALLQSLKMPTNTVFMRLVRNMLLIKSYRNLSPFGAV